MARFDHRDDSSIIEYSELMSDLRWEADRNPLRPGTQFEMQLSAPSPRTDDGAQGSRRQITPSLREQLINTTSWYLVRPLQSGVGKNAQVWLASANAPTTNEVDSDDTNGDYVVVKIMQESLRTYPDVSWSRAELVLWRFQQDLVSSAVEAYTLMADFQGQTIPYFFGHVKKTAASGEELDLLVFEFLRGPRLDSEVDLSDHPDFAKWSDWNVYKLVAESTNKTLTTAHERGIAHNDIRPRNLFLDYDHNCLVKIDWEFCQIHSEDHVHFAIQDEQMLVAELIMLPRGTSDRVVREWVIDLHPDWAEYFPIKGYH